MICPKCQGSMRTFDKNGIHIEQCSGCRGIFLDGGELEQIISAENSYYSNAAPPPSYQPGPPPPMPHGGHAPTMHHGYSDSPRAYRGGYADSPRGYRGYGDSPKPYGHHGHYGHRRRKSFLENLLD
ncbi:zf-TFIIB domain-containing protein [Amycolatopsis suaedae]|uniref:Transcriptional regulator n=1 Tax=Amycolatopsis suaedae TaxID=2510978 RepID=A0A4Q7JAM9_9PSEU|nr:zf-TFIIB domain-containing protein [Amycolatopsis suaedae]RZQ64329.1 transcriptional regulator [Amycolatopsis suaedae]